MYLIFFLIYFLLSTFTSFGFTASNGVEYLVGAFTVTIAMAIIEKLVYRSSYTIVGNMYSTGVISGSEAGRNAHWFIRMFLWLAVFAISLTPLSDILLSPVIHWIYPALAEKYHAWLQLIIDSFMSNI